MFLCLSFVNSAGYLKCSLVGFAVPGNATDNNNQYSVVTISYSSLETILFMTLIWRTNKICLLLNKIHRRRCRKRKFERQWKKYTKFWYKLLYVESQINPNERLVWINLQTIYWNNFFYFLLWISKFIFCTSPELNGFCLI